MIERTGAALYRCEEMCYNNLKNCNILGQNLVNSSLNSYKMSLSLAINAG